MTTDDPHNTTPWLASWAPPTSRLGALQRGRGDGARAAVVGGGAAAEEVVACVIEDPRWDGQVESRSDYYARLLLTLHADLGPIAARLAALAEHAPLDSSDLWLPLGVCSELAVRGHTGARELLAGLIAHTRLWEQCLDALMIGGEALIAAVVSPVDAAAFVARAAPAELDAAVDLINAPWTAWAAEIPALHPALARRDAARRLREAPPVPIDSSLSSAALLELELPPRRMRELADLLDPRRDTATTAALLRVATTAKHPARSLALRLLGRRQCVDLLDDAASFLRAETNVDRRGANSPLRSGYIHYLGRLPAASVLPLARAWFAEPWPLSLAAGEIFSRHATGDDRPMLEAAGENALIRGDMYRLCAVLEALEVLEDPASMALLCSVVRDVPYSYARQRALAALAPHYAHAEVDALLTDALWDCEVEARRVACEQADLDSPIVRARLDEIAADDREDDPLRALARSLRTGP